MDIIEIFGHKKPDTDSVTSAIALSNLKNCLGIKSVPKVLGKINNETKISTMDRTTLQRRLSLHDI